MTDGGTPRFDGLGRVRRPEHHQVGDGAQRGELLDRLVGRAVLAEPDRIVAEDVDHREPAQRREADRRSHVVGEDEEGRSHRPHAAVQRQPVQDRAHGVLTDAEVHVARARAARGHVAAILDYDIGRGCEISGPTHQLGELRRQGVHDLARRGARGLRVLGRKLGESVVPTVRQPTGKAPLQLGGEVGVRLAVGVVLRLPLGFEPGPPLPRAAPLRQGRVGHVERFEARPAQMLLGEPHLRFAERGAVGLGGILLVRAAEGDVGADDHE